MSKTKTYNHLQRLKTGVYWMLLQPWLW